MSHPVPVPAFDLQPRDTLCQGVRLLRSKWQPRRMLGPVVAPLRGACGAWPLPQDRVRWQDGAHARWIEWLEGPGLGIVAGHVLAVAAASAPGERREVERMDADLDRQLEPDAVRASREGGASLLLACDGLRHGGVLGALRQDWLGAGSYHWGTVWGALSAVFSMPPAAAALVALFGEWEALDPPERRGRPVGEAVAWFARDSGPALANCRWIESRVKREFLRIA